MENVCVEMAEVMGVRINPSDLKGLNSFCRIFPVVCANDYFWRLRAHYWFFHNPMVADKDANLTWREVVAVLTFCNYWRPRSLFDMFDTLDGARNTFTGLQYIVDIRFMESLADNANIIDAIWAGLGGDDDEGSGGGIVRKPEFDDDRVYLQRAHDMVVERYASWNTMMGHRDNADLVQRFTTNPQGLLEYHLQFKLSNGRVYNCNQ